MQVQIPNPSSAGVEQALAVARRWLPAFLEGRRAEDELYVEGVSTWHNIDEWEAEIERTPSRTRQIRAGARLEVTDVRLRVSTAAGCCSPRRWGPTPTASPYGSRAAWS